MYQKAVIQTTIVSGNVWPQFVMQVLTGDCKPPVCRGRVVVQGWRWFQWVARRCLPIVTISLSLTVFVVLWLVMDRQTFRHHKQTDI